MTDSKPRLAYVQSGSRDHRLDLLRGYAVFAMSVNHFGLDASIFHHVSGRSVFLINAAEVFLFVSGLTLGVVAARRPAIDGVARCWRRAWQIVLAVLLMTLAGPLLEGGEAVGSAGELISRIGAVLTLREALFWSDVLVAYVLFLIAVPPLLILLERGRPWTAAAIVAAMYLGSRIDPDHLMLPFASFRNVAANAPLFLGGLILGWRRDAVAAWWGAWSGRRFVDGAAVVAGATLIVVYAGGGFGQPALEAFLESASLESREYRMPVLPLLVVFIYLRLLWLLVDRFWRPLSRALGWFMMPLGRSALVAYAAHALMMPVAWSLVGWFGIGLDRDSVAGATIITAGYLGLIHACVFGVRVAWTRTPAGGRGWWAPGLSLACIALTLSFGGAGSHRDPGGDDDEDRWPPAWEVMFDRLGHHDGPDAALAVVSLPSVDALEEGRWLGPLAGDLAEVIDDELGPPENRGRVRVVIRSLREDDAFDLATLNRRLAIEAEPVAPAGVDADADVLILIAPAFTEDAGLDELATRIDDTLARARSARASVLAVLALPRE